MPPDTRDPLQQLPDLALVQRARAGDEAAFELIMRRHNRLLFRAARGIVDNDSDAQDVVQEAYLRAFTRLDAFRAEAALGTWLTRIAINVALDTARGRGRTVPLDDPETAMEADPLGQPAPASHAPDALAHRGQMRGLLESAIAGLPPIYRSVFMLRAVEEMSVEDAATSLGVSADVVKTRFLRARALLRDALGAQVEAQSADAFEFAGARCDRIVAQVLGELRRRGLVGPDRPPFPHPQEP